MNGQNEVKPRVMPKPIPYIVLYSFCERFSSIGVAAILAIFLNTKIGLSEHQSTAVMHYFYFASYFFGIFGAVIADSWLGRFKTLFYGMSLLGGVGNILLAVGTINHLNYLIVPFTAFALFFISFGMGCLEPNLPAYSGDQYRFPLEEKGFSICIGVLFIMFQAARVLAMIVGPTIRTNTKCFGADDCYPAVFGVFVLTKFIAIAAIIIGKKFAVVIEPSGNLFVKVCGCIWHGIKQKILNRSSRVHWLDNSISKYGRKTVEDTKQVLHVLALLPPLIVVATLFFQQASRWVFQSRQMNGSVGNFEIKPDQMPLFNAISVVIFVPMCEGFINPLLSKIGLKSNLHRVILGGYLSITSFILAAIIQFKVEAEPKSVHMLWQIPQHMILALGEVLVYVQILQFGYTQAPKEMKSVLQAFFSMIIGGGNLIVALIASNKIFDSMAYEYLMFAGIVFIAMIFFTILALRYEYVDIDDGEDEMTTLKNEQEMKRFNGN